MASAPKFKIYRHGKYIASCKFAEDAAALVSVSGGIVKYDHKLTVWREGNEEFSAAESYDQAAFIMNERARRGTRPPQRTLIVPRSGGRADDNPSYRSAMTDAGRGHLLR